MAKNYLTPKNLVVLKEYSKNQDIKLIEEISNIVVANVVHTIFKEAVRTYEEDLPLDEGYMETHSITTSFYTDIELYDPKYVFWEDNGLDPWYVCITIEDKMERKLDFEGHNRQCKDLYLSENGKLANIFCKMDVFATHETWKYKFVQVVFQNVYDCFMNYLKL